MPTIYAAITNHGFGHATRMASVLATLRQQMTDLSLILATEAPSWLLESYLPGGFIQRPRTFDVGVEQADSLQIDRAATLAKLQALRDRAPDLVAEEAAFLRSKQVDLVLGDIPPLATEIAAAAGVPCWMCGNFGWDYIYRDWVDRGDTSFRAVTDWMASQYARCDRLFRLPFAEPMTAFRGGEIEDVGLTGGMPRYAPQQVRSLLGLRGDRPTVLLTFGGLGLNGFPYDRLTRFRDWQFITFDRQAPSLPNLAIARDRALRPVDVMPLCDRLVIKPGYSTLSEACRVGVPVVCTTRAGFIEAELLLDGLRRWCHHVIIDPAALFEGDWEFLTAPMTPPLEEHKPDPHGDRAIAAAIQAYLT